MNYEVPSVWGMPSWNGAKYWNENAWLCRLWYIDHSCAKVHPKKFSRLYEISRQTHIDTPLRFYIIIRMIMITYINWLCKYFPNFEITLRINHILSFAEQNLHKSSTPETHQCTDSFKNRSWISAAVESAQKLAHTIRLNYGPMAAGFYW